MRELPIKATIRLWDTYLSEEGSSGFARFHLYVCAAFLKEWKAELLKRTDFHTLLMFLQSLPTAKWGDKEINLLVAEAFREGDESQAGSKDSLRSLRNILVFCLTHLSCVKC